jgi:predicted acyltransferase (DUF342 family)
MAPDVEVPSESTQTLGVIQGDLIVGHSAIIKGEGTPPKITVSGTVHCEGDSVFECSLAAENMTGEGYVVIKGDLNIKQRVKIGNGSGVNIRISRRGFEYSHQRAVLEVDGKLTAETVDIDNRLAVGKDLECQDVDVGGSLEVKGNTRARGKIDVGGKFLAVGEVEGEIVDVGGSVDIESKVKLEKIDVGGSAKVSGGRIENVDVGGSFESRDSLEFGSIDVGGSVRLSGKSVGGDIDVGGVCKVQGDLQFGKVDVGGVVEITGSGKGDSLDVGGVARVGGSLQLSGKIDVGGRVEVGGDLSAEDVDVGGSAKAQSITVKRELDVGGSITTTTGTSATEIEIGRHSEVIGPIRAEKVVIGNRARVEDVYAKIITMEERARARNLYGENISIESRCEITGEVQYTGRLDTEERVHFVKNPMKVEKLPQ